MNLWGGRFTKQTAGAVWDFHSSIHFDWRLFPYDIEGSRVHARMLARQGVLTRDEAECIVAGLDAIEKDLIAGKVEFRPAAEDIHMHVEALLIERIGDVGRKLHTGRSRNDQVATDVRLYLKAEAIKLDWALLGFQEALTSAAEAEQHTVLPGYTHLQRAQPILLAHHWLAYVEMLQRDRYRLVDCIRRADASPLGAGALAGVAYPIDREWTARELGFADILYNSLDAVSDRDFLCEFMSFAAITMMHLSRLCEEVILWASQEFGFIELDDAYATGSSIMPQKKNPDVAELARGKTGRVYGHLLGLLTVMKGLPLAYNKDMQEDKEALFDTVDTLQATLSVLTPMVQTWNVDRERMLQATASGFLNATDLADYLVRKGLPFRQAHEIVGRAVLRCVELKCSLEQLPLQTLRSFAPQIEEDVHDALRLDGVLAARAATGGTAPSAVTAGLRRAKGFLHPLLSPR